MIVRLRGVLLEAGEGRVVVDCHGVGYEVSVPESVLAHVGSLGESVDLYVRQIVREDDVSLYGFTSSASRHLFDQLRGVKGCGARISLSVLGALGESVAGVIAAQDAKRLTVAPGVGPKLAERIVMELKDKMGDPTLLIKSSAVVVKPEPKDELVEALMALGYRRGDVDAVCDDARAEADDIEGQVLAALRRLKR